MLNSKWGICEEIVFQEKVFLGRLWLPRKCTPAIGGAFFIDGVGMVAFGVVVVVVGLLLLFWLGCSC